MYDIDNITILKPNEISFLEKNCGLSFEFAKKFAGEDGRVPFWSFLMYDRPLSEQEITRAHELAREHGWE